MAAEGIDQGTGADKQTERGQEGRGGTDHAVSLDSISDPDATAQKQDCDFILYTELVDVQPVGAGRVGTTQPGAIGTGVTLGKVDVPPDMRRLLHDATVNYRIMRGVNPHSWASGIVTDKDTVTEDALVSRLMDQIANRAASDLRNPHPKMPE
jgi:hypothetical protein